jgi:hypothetical protein
MKATGGIYKISDDNPFPFRVERIGAFIVRKKSDVDECSPKEIVINTSTETIDEERLLELLKKIL